jgi:hypothetical protein
VAPCPDLRQHHRDIWHLPNLLVSIGVCAVAGVQASKAFFEAERRYNYTTPKTFLELIKLYKNVLTGKRKQTQEAIDR